MTEREDAIVQALIIRLRKQRLPRALALKDKVERGQVLNEFDIRFLEEVFAGVSRIQPIMDQHPELQPLIAKMATLYHEIVEKALENEQHRNR